MTSSPWFPWSEGPVTLVGVEVLLVVATRRVLLLFPWGWGSPSWCPWRTVQSHSWGWRPLWSL